MIKSIGKLTLVTILAATVMGVPMGISTQAQTTPPPATPETPATPDAKPKAFPISKGKVSAVDTAGMTITLMGKTTNRVFTITSTTKIKKAGKPATLADIAVGDVVTGQAVKSADGKVTAKSIYVVTKTPPAAPTTTN
jgi:Domain of unknown function (DUF5666)